MDFANQLRSSVDILPVVAERVPLRRAGTRWVGNCPFHREKTASFGVNTAMQIFKCFGCGEGGNVITFIMKLDGLTFWEACKYLAEKHNIPIPKRSAHSDEQTKLRAGIFEANEIAQKMFREALLAPSGASARAYLEKRGVNAAVAEEFGLGLADRGGQALTRRLQQAGFAANQLEGTGLVSRRDDSSFYDRFRGRLIFPIHNETGKIIGFGGRAISDDDQPKYLNSPETELYRKRQVLYNLHRARKPIREQDHSVLVEGYMDVIGLHGGGVGEAVASCGTALVETQARLMARHSENIVVNFDPDKAGVNATEKSLEILLDESMHIRVLALPGGLDPDEFVRERGADAYRELLAKAPRYFHWLADRARQRFDMYSAEGRVEGVRYLLPSIQRLRDKFERAAVAAELAHDLGIDKLYLLEQVRGLGSDRQRERTRIPAIDLAATERLLLRELLASAETRRHILPQLDLSRLPVASSTRNILQALLAEGDSDAFDYGAIEGRLEASDRDLLTSLVFADEASIDQQESNSEPEQGVAQAEACLQKLYADGLEQGRTEIKRRIREAEQGGDVEQAIALSQQLAGMESQGRSRRRRVVE